jgi:hypothetical protein
LTQIASFLIQIISWEYIKIKFKESEIQQLKQISVSKEDLEMDLSMPCPILY